MNEDHQDDILLALQATAAFCDMHSQQTLMELKWPFYV